MRRILSAVSIVFILATTLNAQGISPRLSSAMAGMLPGEKIPVILILSAQVDLSPYRTAQKGLGKAVLRANRQTRKALIGQLKETRRQNRKALIEELKNHAKNSQKNLISLLHRNQAESIKPLWLINGIALTANSQLIKTLAAMPQVAKITTDALIEAPAPLPAAIGSPEASLLATGVPELWNLGFDGQGIVVATMDTGVDIDHPDLATRWRGGLNSWYDPNGEHLTVPADSSGHGTGTMGVMVGGNAGGTDIGVAPGAEWIAVKIFNDAGVSRNSRIHEGFQWLLDPDNNPATDDAPDIVNNSWSFEQNSGACLDQSNPDPELDVNFHPDIATLRAAGIEVVFSAGNSGPGGIAGSSESPANYPEAFAVGSVGTPTSITEISSFSSRGPSACDGSIFPDLVAPGYNIRLADLTFGGVLPNSYRTDSGTSFSAPYVAGVMALLLHAYPGSTLVELEEAMSTTATDLGMPGSDNDYGFGLVDPVAAYNYLAGLPLTPLNNHSEFVKQVYRDFLSREADATGLAYWTGILDSGSMTRAQVVEQYLLSPEFGQTMAPVTRLYFAYFNRIPDYAGLMYWVGRYQQGASLNQISDAFAAAAEFAATYGSLSNTDFVNLVYQNVLGRAPDAGGLSYWIGALDSASQTRGQVMTGFSESPESQALMANRIYVTMVYIGLLRRSPDQGGFDYWVGQMDAGSSGLGLIDGFLASPEYATRFDSITYPTPVLQFAYPFNLLQEIEQEDETGDGSYDNLTSIDYNYDANGRYIGYQKSYDAGSDGSINSTTTVTLTYNAAGNPKTRIEESDWNFDATIDSRKRQTYVYNLEGHILRTVEEHDLDLDGTYDQTFVTLNSYDSSGQLTTSLRSYDADNNGVVNDLARTIYSYDGNGIVQAETEELDYGNDGQLDWIKTTTYLVDAQGHMLSEIVNYDTNGDTTIDRVDTISYSYDGSSRLTQIQNQQDDLGDGSINAISTQTISYAVGNDPTNIVEEIDFDNDGTIDYRTSNNLSFTAAGFPTSTQMTSPDKPVMVPLEAQLN